jgi:hypothetical protein
VKSCLNIIFFSFIVLSALLEISFSQTEEISFPLIILSAAILLTSDARVTPNTATIAVTIARENERKLSPPIITGNKPVTNKPPSLYPEYCPRAPRDLSLGSKICTAKPSTAVSWREIKRLVMKNKSPNWTTEGVVRKLYIEYSAIIHNCMVNIAYFRFFGAEKSLESNNMANTGLDNSGSEYKGNEERSFSEICLFSRSKMGRYLRYPLGNV